MIIATYIKAPNDANGNPRRGWILSYLSPDGGICGGIVEFGFVDEGYAGRAALRPWAPVEGPTIAVTPNEYRHWRKWADGAGVQREMEGRKVGQ